MFYFQVFFQRILPFGLVVTEPALKLRPHVALVIDVSVEVFPVFVDLAAHIATEHS